MACQYIPVFSKVSCHLIYCQIVIVTVPFNRNLASGCLRGYEQELRHIWEEAAGQRQGRSTLATQNHMHWITTDIEYCRKGLGFYLAQVYGKWAGFTSEAGLTHDDDRPTHNSPMWPEAQYVTWSRLTPGSCMCCCPQWWPQGRVWIWAELWGRMRGPKNLAQLHYSVEVHTLDSWFINAWQLAQLHERERIQCQSNHQWIRGYDGLL